MGLGFWEPRGLRKGSVLPDPLHTLRAFGKARRPGYSMRESVRLYYLVEIICVFSYMACLTEAVGIWRIQKISG